LTGNFTTIVADDRQNRAHFVVATLDTTIDEFFGYFDSLCWFIEIVSNPYFQINIWLSIETIGRIDDLILILRYAK
jgi:hypothetical protein